MPYSKAHKAETRARILLSAQKLFKMHGYKAVSIDHIMADAALTRGGFYAHFKSKKELINASLNGQDGVIFMTSFMDKSDLPLKERIEKLLSGYLSEMHRDTPSNGCPVAAMGNTAARLGGDTSKAYARLVKGMSLRLKRNMFPDMPDDKILSCIIQIVGCLNLARATVENKMLSDQILAIGRRDISLFIVENSDI